MALEGGRPSNGSGWLASACTKRARVLEAGLGGDARGVRDAGLLEVDARDARIRSARELQRRPAGAAGDVEQPDAAARARSCVGEALRARRSVCQLFWPKSSPNSARRISE